MRITSKRLRVEYRVSQVILLCLLIGSAVAFQSFLEAKEITNAALIAVFVVLLPGLYAFYTFRIVFKLAELQADAFCDGSNRC